MSIIDLDTDDGECPLMRLGQRTRRCIATLVRVRTRSCIDSPHVRMQALVIGRRILPPVVNERTDGNAQIGLAMAGIRGAGPR